MAETMKILGFAGSLRKGSYNKALLRAAVELAPKGSEVQVFDLEGIGLFSEDLEGKPVARVKEFKAAIEAADALLIATPEYNYSMPGVLKNAIDWASRPYGDNSFSGKPVALMGASVGTLGTARAQYHLRQCCVFLNMHVLNQPEVMVASAQDKIDPAGRVNDEETRKRIAQLLAALVAWTHQLQ
ncbi:MAG: NAD(P)H-dependent oxidoreductase [Planctomycetes bacterium]|nr:NAD(P)H-dependent oxidoreductase [Planctomycetota bacterium]